MLTIMKYSLKLFFFFVQGSLKLYMYCISALSVVNTLNLNFESETWRFF